MPKLALFSSRRSALEIARISAHAMDGTLASPAELWVSALQTKALLLGAFQRRGDAAANEAPALRRTSGGPALALGPGIVHLVLALENAATLTPCDPPRLVNRYVRPLLRALATFGQKAAYFGRDWVSVQHRPLAWVGFAHDGASQRATFEAVIGVDAPWSIDRNRASFLEKSEITLAEAVGHEIALDDVIAAILEAYGKAFDGAIGQPRALAVVDPVVANEPAWSAIADEAIGDVCAGRDRDGVFRVGGQLLASRDAIARLEAKMADLDASASDQAIGHAVDSELGRPGIALHGIKSLTSVRDVIAKALRI